MTTVLSRLEAQFLEILDQRFTSHIEVISRAQDTAPEVIYDLMLADEDKLAEALGWAVISFDQAMRRPWIENPNLVA